jgi:CRP-like cAMP-binding protein
MTEAEASSRLLREIFLAGFMSGLPPENVKWAAARLARNMSDVRLRTGDVLYRQGELPDAHYFVVSGEMRLEAEGLPPWLLGERSLVGTLDITLDRPRARNAVAARDSFLLRMPAGDWLDMLEDNFELTLRAVQGLADGVHRLRVELDDFESDSESPPSTRMNPVPSGSLGFVERIFLLRGVRLLAEGEVQALTNLAEQAADVTWAAGDALAVRGEPIESMFVVVSGEVTATRAESARAERFGPGMLVFGSAAASARDLGYEAQAAVATRTLQIAREDYYDVMEEHFALARSTLKALAAERELLVNEKESRARRGAPST